MSRAARVITEDEAETILSVAGTVRARRVDLGLSQAALDRECGFSVPTVYRVERKVVSHRSVLPNDPIIAKVLDILSVLEKKPKGAPSRPVRRMLVNARAALAAAPARKEVRLTATLKRCPEQDMWITQGGCEGMLSRNPNCKNGKPCRGVKFRRSLETKDIDVEYKPPTESELEPASKRFGRVL